MHLSLSWSLAFSNLYINRKNNIIFLSPQDCPELQLRTSDEQFRIRQNDGHRHYYENSL